MSWFILAIHRVTLPSFHSRFRPTNFCFSKKIYFSNHCVNHLWLCLFLLNCWYYYQHQFMFMYNPQLLYSFKKLNDQVVVLLHLFKLVIVYALLLVPQLQLGFFMCQYHQLGLLSPTVKLSMLVPQIPQFKYHVFLPSISMVILVVGP